MKTSWKQSTCTPFFPASRSAADARPASPWRVSSGAFVGGRLEAHLDEPRLGPWSCRASPGVWPAWPDQSTQARPGLEHRTCIGRGADRSHLRRLAAPRFDAHLTVMPYDSFPDNSSRIPANAEEELDPYSARVSKTFETVGPAVVHILAHPGEEEPGRHWIRRALRAGRIPADQLPCGQRRRTPLRQL